MYPDKRLMALGGGVLLVCGLAALASFAEETQMTNMLPAFEAEQTDGAETRGWKQFVWNGGDAQFSTDLPGRGGGRCVSIASKAGADAAWTTTVRVELDAWYRLSGWIKTRDVAGATGALLNIQNLQSVRTNAVSGTQDWTRVSATFMAEAEELEINCLFGGWGNATGQAWYDDVRLEPVAVTLPTTAGISLADAKPGGVISPQLFGHNLEHTRRAIWTGLSAEMVTNRKFAAVDSGLAMHWWTLPGGGVTVDDQVSYAGKHALRLDYGDDPHCGVWQQHDWLTFTKGTKYAFRVWVKSDAAQTIQLRVVNRPGFTNIVDQQYTTQPGDWQPWRGEFEAPLSARGARLEIRLGTPGPVWIGAVSLMPADNFHGMRRDVVGLLKQLKPGNLRWPGGCFAEYYDWREGLLPVDQRPPIGPHQWVGLLPDSDGYDNHEIGIDEYIALCREIGAEPAITTRFSEGSPEEAGAWVEYCNGASTTPWGKRRAERGHPEPYGVKYWYLGNELTGMSLLKGEARTNPAVLAAACREHAEAMTAADPDIVLNVGVPSDAHWLQPLLAETGDMLDLVQTGFYFNPDHEVSMASMVNAPTHRVLPALKRLRQALDEITPARKHLDITFYEWNVMWDRSGDARSGVFAALMLNLFCREAEPLGLVQASYFQPVTEGAIDVRPTNSTLAPDGQVFALYAAHQGNRLLHTPIAADGSVDLCASLTPDGIRLFITAVNRNGADACTLRIALADHALSPPPTAELLIPRDLDPDGSFTHHSEQLTVREGNEVTLKLPPYAIAGIHLLLKTPWK